MHIDDIKRGLRAEIKIRENEQYATFQCNVRQMCKDVLAKLEEQESVIAELKAENESLLQQNRELCQALQVMYSKEAYDKQKRKRCVAMASNCRLRARWFGDNAFYKKERWASQWHKRWLELADKFK